MLHSLQILADLPMDILPEQPAHIVEDFVHNFDSNLQKTILIHFNLKYLVEIPVRYVVVHPLY